MLIKVKYLRGKYSFFEYEIDCLCFCCGFLYRFICLIFWLLFILCGFWLVRGIW